VPILRFLHFACNLKGFILQSITVAVVDDDAGRREKTEHCLQSEGSVMVLRNAETKKNEVTVDRRRSDRINVSPTENLVAKVRRLKPRILLANLKQCTEGECAMLIALRRECPDTLVVMLVDASASEEEGVINALANGARGYLNVDADMSNLSKAVKVIDRGENWVPRKMLGNIMNQVLGWCSASTIGA